MEKMVAGSLFWPYTTIANSTLHFNTPKINMALSTFNQKLSIVSPIQIQRIIKRKLGIEQCPFNETLADLGAKEGHLQLILQSIQIQHNAAALNKGITLHDTIYSLTDKINENK
jgi:hypothetical protein